MYTVFLNFSYIFFLSCLIDSKHLLCIYVNVYAFMCTRNSVNV